MAIQIEIVSRSADSVSAAFYFPIVVGDRLPAANDPARQPAGTRLSAGEITSLRSGALHEIVRSVSIKNFRKAQIAARLEAMWTDSAAEALADYKSKNTDQNIAWDGTSWSNT